MGDCSHEDLLKIYSEWTDDHALFIIIQGTAEILIPRQNGWYKLASVGPAGVFGELSFFDRLPRSARVVVLTD